MKRTFEEYAYHLTGSASLVNHRHKNPDSFEVIQVHSGEGSAFLHDRTYTLKPGMILFIDASSLHCILPVNVQEYCRSKLIIDKQYLHDVFTAMQELPVLEQFFLPPAGKCFYLDKTQAKEADELFCQMKEAFSSAGSRLEVMMLLFRLFVLCKSASSQNVNREEDKLAPVMKFIHEHIAEQITLEQVADQLHMNKYYLCHLFRRLTGLTLMQYVSEQRISAAREQLKSSSEPISSIALNCGFAASSHFCTAFRKREGITPSEFRRNYHRRLTNTAAE